MCVSLRSADFPQSVRDMMWGGRKGSAPPLCWHGTLLVFELISSTSFCLRLSESLPIQAPSPSFPSEVSNLFSKYGGQASIFPLIWSQCDGASWQLPSGVVLTHGVAMDTSLSWPEVLRPPANLYGTSSQAHLLVMSLNVL